MNDKKDYENVQDGLSTLGGVNPSKNASARKASGTQVEKRIETAAESTKKLVVSKEKGNGDGAAIPSGPVGLDVGTSHIVAAQNRHNYVYSVQDLNAFFTVPNAKFAKNILSQKEIKYYENDHEYYIIGDSAQNFANMFNVNTRRPMQDGFLSPKEGVGLRVIEAIVTSLVQEPKNSGEILCFSIPGAPFDGYGSVVCYESVVQ